jgi:hypothetical protein
MQAHVMRNARKTWRFIGKPGWFSVPGSLAVDDLTAHNMVCLFNDSVDFLPLAEGDQSESLEVPLAILRSEDFDDFPEL